ncbi:hypothetical protein HFP57_12240 [Parasphingopyxis algicola]|uniref:hypothetical protein n=1 Tax=Parasphingopyxis algicola TaxID=2026624 RepID=UPI0015A2D3F5|nr:hypothetical protein [Parasphingopyxis algicola]QLC25711.1 hypothetical protein HFP57_12240 [Parasphingopyxis algicola]
MVRAGGVMAALAVASCSGGSEPDDRPDAVATDTANGVAVEMETLDAMPVDFRGRWDFSAETCRDPASEMRLDIAADRIAYYESAATPETITRTGPGAVTIVHRFSGEGEEWQETLAYELDGDGERLTVSTPDGSMSIRMRCGTTPDIGE